MTVETVTRKRLQLFSGRANLPLAEEVAAHLGARLGDPERTYIDASVELAADVTVFPGSLLQGATVVGAGAEIGPNCHLVDCTIGERATLSSTVAKRVEIGADAVVGPFTWLPMGTRVAPGEVIGPCFSGWPDEHEGGA